MKQIVCAALFLIHAAAFSQDLIVTNYSGATTFSRYEEFSPSVTVKNTGIVGINTYFYAGLYLSTDDQWQASDIAIESISTSTLGAGQSATAKPYRGKMDAAPGTYYLIIRADHTGRITETDEANNLMIIPNFVVTPSNIDFTFSSFSLDKSTYPQNSLVKPSYVLSNLGSTNAGGVIDIQFALSTDATFSQYDHRLRYANEILTGPDNITSNEYLGLVLPTVTNGTYYILAWIDHDQFDQEHFPETNESNNVFVIPITIQSSNPDLVISYVFGTTYNSGTLSTGIQIQNNGTTGVAGYTVGAQLVPPGGTPYDFNYQNTDYLDPFDSYIGPGESKYLSLTFHPYQSTPGTYYSVFSVNFMGEVFEANRSNNIYTDETTPIFIAPPPSPGVAMNSVSASGAVDDTDQQINLNLNLTNSGNTTGFNQNYTVVVKNSLNTIVHTQQTNVYIDFSPGQTVNKPIVLNLSSALPVGSYQISVSCTSSCYSTPSLISNNLTVTPTQYTLTGSVKGEDGQSITNGKLFLYQDDGSGDVRFIQKIVPYTGPGFSFGIDTHRHTLYFIPDPVQYPDYVPTIYGKTLSLQESNFFTASANMNVTLEVLKVNALGTGTGIINGSVSSGSSSGRTRESEASHLSAAGIPVILISSTGKVVGITYTNESGFYEFNNLPRDSYQVMLSFELDNPQVMNPFSVDITDKNMTVNLELKPDGVYPAASQLYLPQVITLDEFSMYQYGDPSITPDAQSDAGLPIEYSSSDNTIATVIDNEIVIIGVGTVVITAKQAGNTFYLPASVDRSLTVNKANQSLTLSPLAGMTFGDAPFTIESTSSSGLAVNLSSSDPAIASVNGNEITIHGAGEVEIIAEQPGNEFYTAASSVREWLTIEKSTQSISFDALPELTSDAGPFALSATTSSGLDIEFESGDEEIVSIAGNIATIHKEGTVSITARQSGNQNYFAAEDVVHDVVINLVLGTEGFDLTKHVFPNPTTDFVVIQLPELRSVEVFDVMGRTQRDATWLNDRIDFSRTRAGVYFVKLAFKDHSMIARIIKK